MLMIVIPKDILNDLLEKAVRTQYAPVNFNAKDDGDVFFYSKNGNYSGVVILEGSEVSNNSYNIIIQSTPNDDVTKIMVKGFFVKDDIKYSQEIMIVPDQNTLFDRIKGLYETDKISNSVVTIIGLGSGGSPIAIELAKAGVMHFNLIDDDRIELGNVVRHVCGISDLGRFKTKAVKELMLNKNPYAKINTFEIAASTICEEIVRKCISESDVVLCATDNRESRLLINRLCIELDKICIYGGAFRRAYGGHVLRVRPKKSMCFQCFLQNFPDFANNVEISSEQQAAEIAYSDTIVPIEPGLSTDILPISLLMTKLTILELLKGKEHSMTSLYEDFECDFYLWLNRREEDSGFDAIVPLSSDSSDYTILKWYAISSSRNPECPICGSHLYKYSQEDLELFQSITTNPV